MLNIILEDYINNYSKWALLKLHHRLLKLYQNLKEEIKHYEDDSLNDSKH